MRSRVRALGLAVGFGLAVMTTGIGEAQAPTIYPVPFVTDFAGIAPGAPAAPACTDIPTFKGANLGDGCPPTSATLYEPTATAIDPYGNVFIADYEDRLIRVVYQGGAALTAALIAANPQIPNFVPQRGNIYTLAGGSTTTIARTGSPTAYYCNQAGSGPVGVANNGDACPGAEAYVEPRGMALDANGNLFFANLGGGEGLRVFYVGGAAVAKLIMTETPTLTAVHSGYVYSVAGSSTSGYTGDGALARAAEFENVRDVAIDASGNIYITDGNGANSTTNSNVRVIYSGGTIPATANPVNASPQYGYIYTIAGNTGAPGPACPAGGTYNGDGIPANQAKLNSPYSLFFDPSGNLYVADSCNGRLRVIYQGGSVPGLTGLTPGDIYTVAGGGAVSGPTASGVAATQLNVALLQTAGIDNYANLYVADTTNKYIWRIDAKSGIATIIAGLGVMPGTTTAVAAAPAANYCSGSSGPKSIDTNGDGCPAPEAEVSANLRLTFDSENRMYSVENGNNYVRQYNYNNLIAPTAVGAAATQPLAFSTTAAITLSAENFTLQGAATNEFSDAAGDTCGFNSSIAADSVCVFNVQFAPTQAGMRSGTLQLTGSNGASSLVALEGTGVAAEVAIDPGTQTTLVSGTAAQGVGIDELGNLYVADGTSNQVLKVAAGATTSSVLISGLSNPHQIAIDNAGNIYVADTGNNRVAMTAAAGGAITAMGDGLSAPQGVAADALGDVYVADTGNNRVVELFGAGGQQVTNVSGLSGPTQLAFDPEGDLFIADTGNNRVVELPAGSDAAAVSLGTGTITPAGVAVDAAGDLYISDTDGEQVLEFATGSSIGTPLISALKQASEVVTDFNGSVFVADGKAPGVVYDNRAQGAIGFPLTNVGQTSTSPIAVEDTGNAALNFPSSPVASASGLFEVSPASSNGCMVGTPLGVAANCLLDASFTPTGPGAQGQTVSFTTSAANNSSIAALLSGTGAELVPTTTTVMVTSPTGTIYYGVPVVLTGAVALSSSSGTPTGTVTITVDGKAQPAQSYGSGTYSTTLNEPVGVHAVTVQFSGDTTYASSSASVSFTVAQAVTTTTLSVTPSTPGGNPTILFTAKVGSTSGSGETGTVSFYAGATLLNTSTIGSNGNSTYTSTALTFGSGGFTAVYSGDSNFAKSTSAVVQPSADYAITTSSNNIAIAQGGVASASVTITPLFAGTGILTPSCTGLPANSLCRFQPQSVALDGTDPVGVSLLIYTNVSPTLAGIGATSSWRATLALGFVWLLGGMLLLRRREAFAARLSTLAILLLGFALSVGAISGCSSGNSTSTQSLVTPTGTSTISISFSPASGSLASHSVNFNFTVNGN